MSDMCLPVFMMMSLSRSSRARASSQNSPSRDPEQTPATNLSRHAGGSSSRHPRHPSSMSSQAGTTVGHARHARRNPATAPNFFVFMMLLLAGECKFDNGQDIDRVWNTLILLKSGHATILGTGTGRFHLHVVLQPTDLWYGSPPNLFDVGQESGSWTGSILSVDYT